MNSAYWGQVSKYVVAFVAFLFFTLSATAVPLFSVNSSGTPVSAQISLCLNGKGPVSCQNYSITGENLSINSLVPGRTYSSAGIKLLTPGHIQGATPYVNGYVLFSVSDTVPAEFAVVPTYTVGGTVSGLDGTVVLQLNSSETLNLNSNGGFTFATQFAYCDSYNVTVLTQPDDQMCNVTNGVGTVLTSNITSVAVVCSNEPLAHDHTILQPDFSAPVDAARSGGCMFYNIAHRYYVEHSLPG
ncbi:MAG: hypothetical protein K5Q00_01150 [Gammaproteobacteria bacterium]|nr:hypothetical protein [Gammaproteobacteria bacterium]